LNEFTNPVKKRVKTFSPLPEHILEWAKYWAALSCEMNLKTTDEAGELLDQIFNEFMSELDSTDEIFSPVVARKYQQVAKLCMISSTSRSRAPTIEKEDVEFAYKLVEYLTSNIKKLVYTGLYRNKQEESVQRILGYAKEGISRKELFGKTKDLRAVERNLILQDLVENGMLTMGVVDGETIYRS